MREDREGVRREGCGCPWSVGALWEQELGPRLPTPAAFKKPLPSVPFLVMPELWPQSQECGCHSCQFNTPLFRETWVEWTKTGSAQSLQNENKNGLVFMKMPERSLLGRT